MRVGEKCLSRDWVLESVALSQFGQNISGSCGEKTEPSVINIRKNKINLKQVLYINWSFWISYSLKQEGVGEGNLSWFVSFWGCGLVEGKDSQPMLEVRERWRMFVTDRNERKEGKGKGGEVHGGQKGPHARRVNSPGQPQRVNI